MTGLPGGMGPPPQGPINGNGGGQSMTPNYNFFFNHGGGLGGSGGGFQGGGPGWMPPPPVQPPLPTTSPGGPPRPPGGPPRIPPPVQVPPGGGFSGIGPPIIPGSSLPSPFTRGYGIAGGGQPLPGWAGYLQWLQQMGGGSGGFGPNPSVTTFPTPSGPPLTAPQVQRNLLKFRGPMPGGT